MLVYNVTDEESFKNVRNWMKNIETHATETTDKVSLGWMRLLVSTMSVDVWSKMSRQDCTHHLC